MIAGKALRIEADEERPVFVDSIEIRSLAPGQTVTVRGLTLAPGPVPLDHGVVIEDCAGSVWLEEIDSTYDYESNLEYIHVNDSDDVVVTRSNFGYLRPTPPLAVFLLENSSTYVLDTIVDNCYTTRLDVRGGFLGLSALAFASCGGHGGGSGNSVIIDGGATVEQQGVSGPVLFPVPVIVSGTYTSIPTRARTHQASSPVYEGDSVSVEIAGQPGDLVWVLFSAVGAARRFAKIDVPLFLEAPVMSIALGAVSASGTIEFDAPIGALGLSSSVVINSQAFFWNQPAQRMIFSEPTAVTLLNQELWRADYLYAQTPTWTNNLAGTTSFGASLGSAGDVNGDGFEDVLMMAECWAPSCEVGGKNRFGRLYHGSVDGLVTGAPAWEFVAPGTYVANVGSERRRVRRHHGRERRGRRAVRHHALPRRSRRADTRLELSVERTRLRRLPERGRHRRRRFGRSRLR